MKSPLPLHLVRNSSLKPPFGCSPRYCLMVVYYKSGGIIAVFSVGILLVIACLAGIFQATFTLPGMAALVLTIGMAVDANILIFERIREELKAGKSSENALLGGYEKAFSTIIDANFTTLITASILIWLGTGPVKGFGITLAIGIVTSVFCALFISRFIKRITSLDQKPYKFKCHRER